MSNVAQTVTTIGAVIAVVGLAVGLQTFWIAHILGEISRRLDRLDTRLDGIEQTVLRDHGERIARLEAR